jgi:hypothetical protein
MFKLFNKRHSSNTSNKESPDPFATSDAFQHKRHGSLRNLSYFGASTSVDFATASPTGSSKKDSKSMRVATSIYATAELNPSRHQTGGMSNSKKFVSCQNVSRLTDDPDDRVLKGIMRGEDMDEDEAVADENSENDRNGSGFRGRITKRYNSVTDVLMSKFCSTRMKKLGDKFAAKKNRLETNYEEEEHAGHKFQPPERSQTLQMRASGPNIKSSTSHDSLYLSSAVKKTANKSQETNGTIARNGKTDRSGKELVQNESVRVINPYLRSAPHRRADSDEAGGSDEANAESNEDDEEEDEAVPVFKGVKLISNEFVDLKPPHRPPQVCSSTSSKATISSELTTSHVAKYKIFYFFMKLVIDVHCQKIV